MQTEDATKILGVNKWGRREIRWRIWRGGDGLMKELGLGGGGDHKLGSKDPILLSLVGCIQPNVQKISTPTSKSKWV